jgi:hypothetical protein
MDNFLTFVNNHDKHFKKYDSIDNIDKSSLSGWLYIFCASAYDQDITKLFEELVDKFGKTINQLFVRMDQYDPEVNVQNIEAIHCTLPNQRERLIKAFLNERTSIKPVAGLEYFTNSRNLIKVLMLIIVFISDEEIVMYEEFYAKKNKVEYSKLFDKIQEYLEEIKKNNDFELKIENDINEPIVDKGLVCEFCNTTFTNQTNLNVHQRTAKYCLKLQQNLKSENTEEKDNTSNNIILNCEYCNKEFTVKSNLKTHYSSCVLKREHDIKKEITDKYEKQLEDLKQTKDKELEELRQVKDKQFSEYSQSIKEEILKLKLTNEHLEKINTKLEKEVDNYKNMLFLKVEILSDFILKNKEIK